MGYLDIVAELFVVAPFTGAWIEIFMASPPPIVAYTSHPSRVRGLKSLEQIINVNHFFVAPFTGAWIEIGCAFALQYQ